MNKILASLTVLLLTLGAFPSAMSAQSIFDAIAESHIQGNVPDPADFDSFLQRDLETFFRHETGDHVQVQFELLRFGPTQSGVAYPKYYLWVKLLEKETVTGQGAVRVAAVDKTHFEITHFFDQVTIRRDPERLYAVFPGPVADKIKTKLQQP